MRKTKKAIATLAIAGMLSMIPFNALAASTVPTRLGGYNAAQTAVQIAEQTGWTGTAILSSPTSYGMVDALTASPLAAFLKAPILLQEAGNVLNADTKAVLAKLKVKTVYVTSGTAVISQAVLDQLSSMDIKVVSLGGADRFETSVNIAKQMVALGANVSKVAVAYGWLNQDALSIAAIAAAQTQPILLTEKDSIPASVKAFLLDNPSIKTTHVIGGTAVISESVKTQLPNATRLYGNSAYDTNVAILKAFESLLKYDNVFIANGETAIDALAGVPLAAKFNAGIVLTNGVANEGTAYVKSKMTSASVVTALGGTAVVPDVVRTGAVSIAPPPSPVGGGGGGGTVTPPVVTVAYANTAADLTAAIANQNITTITLTNHITQDITVPRSLTIELGPYVLTGNVVFQHNLTGTSSLTSSGPGSIVGNLTVDTKNGSFVNNVVVSGIVTVVNVKDGTWTETAIGNIITITDQDGSRIVIEGSPGSVSVTENATGGLTVTVNAGATVGNIISNAPMNLQVASGGTAGTVTANAPIVIGVASGATVSDINVAAGAVNSTITNNGTTGTVTANAPMNLQVAAGGTSGTVTANAPIVIGVAAGASVTDINVEAGAGNSAITNNGTTGTVTANAAVNLQVAAGGTSGTVTANAPIVMGVAAGATVTDINVQSGAGNSAITNNGTTTNMTVEAGASGTTITNNGTATNVSANAPISLVTTQPITNTTTGTGGTITTTGSTATVVVESITSYIDAVNNATNAADVIAALQSLANKSALDSATIITANAAAYLTDFAANPTTTVNQIRGRVDAVNALKISLQTLTGAVNNATSLIGSRVVGTAVGNVSQASRDAFQAAIDAATTVKNSASSTKAQVDAQVAALASATITFNNAVITGVFADYTALNTAISNATTLIGRKTVGTAIGQVPQAAKDAFQAAITTATAVKNNTSSTQAQVDAQVVALGSATTAFNNSIIAVAPVSKTELNTAIANATTLLGNTVVGTVIGQVPQAAKDAFQAAINAATVVKNNTSATETQVNAQVAALGSATITFNNAIIKVSTAPAFEQLVDKAVDVYNSLSDTDKASLQLARTALQGLNPSDTQWNNIITPLLTPQVITLYGDSETAKAALIVFMKDFATLQYSADRSTLEANLNTFKANNQATFRKLFGNDFTVEQFAGFLMAVHKELPGVINNGSVSLVELSGKPSDQIKEQIVAWTKAAAHIVADPETSQYHIFTTKLSALGLNMDAVVSTQKLLGNVIDPTNAAEKAITLAAIRSQITHTIPSTMTVNESKELQINVTGVDTSIDLVSLLTWASSNQNVADFEIVSFKRVLKAKSAGTTTITATKSGGSAELVHIVVTVQ